MTWRLIVYSTFYFIAFAITIQSEKSSERSTGSPSTTSTGETKSWYQKIRENRTPWLQRYFCLMHVFERILISKFLGLWIRLDNINSDAICSTLFNLVWISNGISSNHWYIHVFTVTKQRDPESGQQSLLYQVRTCSPE